ncbi:MAG: mandelate racemase/muconate lactonizing enzyme family protein [Peptococcaceae bacterium]|nr:mandelate racemase/muconate lactonizing enzyme family protein [Peptococcaceae bacterium]
MKITDVKAVILDYHLEKPVETSFGAMPVRTNVLIRIDTDEGISGIGETWTNFPHWAAEERKITVEKGIKPVILGENPLNISYLWEKMYRALMKSGAGLQWGAKGPLMQAVSGVDIALWDILGKKLASPVYQLLGGKVCTEIKAYASGLGPRDYEEYVQNSLEKGYTAFKLKVGFGKDLDLHNLNTMRRMIGDDRMLMIDSNQGWNDADEAVRHLKLYEKYNLEFIEEPVPADRLEDLKKIKDCGIMPVAGGENVYTRFEFKKVFANEVLNIVQPDITKTGGISEARHVCSMARAWGLPFAPHMFGTAVGLAASLHLLASTPNGLYMEVDANPNPLLTDLLEEAFFSFQNGSFILGEDKPGLGIKLDADLLKDLERR